MISGWARAALTHRLPEPDLANPNDAYRRHTPDTQPMTRIAQGFYGVTHYEADAARGAESEWKTFASLAWLCGGKPSDSGHMSPWDAARNMWGSGA